MRRYLLVAAALVGLVLTSGVPASASTADKAAGNSGMSKVDREIRDVLDRTPGARQTGPLSVELEPGVTLSWPSDVSAQATCSYLDLCLFSSTGYGGYQISFTICAFRNLGTYAYPGGGYWNDKVSSFINNQSSGTWSDFYNWDGVSRWVYLFSSSAYDQRSPTPYDNIIDAVQVC